MLHTDEHKKSPPRLEAGVHPQVITVPCGNCHACLSTKRQNWFFRISEELKITSVAYFVTLTYNDEHLPTINNHPIPRKEDVQKYHKRLRKLHPFKHFLVSEYGGQTSRPHYHAIYFLPHFTQIGQFHKLITQTWTLGNIQVDILNPARINYITKYIVNRQIEKEYAYKNFNLISKGLGKNFISEDNIDYYTSRQQPYVTLQGGQKISMPRYLRNKIFTPEMRERMSATFSPQINPTYERYLQLNNIEEDSQYYYNLILHSNRHNLEKTLKLDKL